jgi:hypothetical protein
MKPQPARHPEVIALALIVLALATGPVRPLPAPGKTPCQFSEIESRLLERVCEIETRIAERLTEIGERIGSRIGSRLGTPRLPIAW